MSFTTLPRGGHLFQKVCEVGSSLLNSAQYVKRGSSIIPLLCRMSFCVCCLFDCLERKQKQMYERRQARIPLAVGRIEAHRDEGKDDAERSLEGLNEPVRPETAPHAIVHVHVIRDEATDATREEIRRAPDRRNGTRNSDAHAEIGMEEERPDVVHGQLDAEAHTVRNRHEPSVDIRKSNLAMLRFKTIVNCNENTLPAYSSNYQQRLGSGRGHTSLHTSDNPSQSEGRDYQPLAGKR